MASNNTNSNTQVVPTLQRVYGLVDEACRAAGDMDAVEYSCLASVAAFAGGLQHSVIAQQYSFLEDALLPFKALEKKELIERRRSEVDRRSFTFVITLKGQDRLALIEKAIALLMVESTPRATEERFEQFIAQMHSFSQMQDGQASSTRLFPAFFLRSLCGFHWCVLEECAVSGVSTTAFAILNLLQDQPAGLKAATIAFRVGISDAMIDAFLESMEERHWLRRSGDTYTITETGMQKCATLDKGITKHHSFNRANISREQWEQSEQVVESCLYLFG